MRRRPRLFPPGMPRAERRVYGAAAVFYLLLFLLLVWPVYPRFAGARPFVLGVPLSLAYVVALVFLSFGALAGLFLWEGRRGRNGGDGPPAGSAVRPVDAPGGAERRDPRRPQDGT